MLSGLSSYLFGAPTVEDHPAVTTKSAIDLAMQASIKNSHFRTTNTDDDWTIVDKASRGNSPLRLEDHPMENLLIEHPSMSVYQQRGGRPNSRGTDSSDDEDDEDEYMDTPQNNRQVTLRHPSSRSARLAAASGSVSAALTVRNKRSAQSAQKRKEARHVNRHQLDRNNKVCKYNSACKKANRKQHMFRCSSGRNNDRKCQY